MTHPIERDAICRRRRAPREIIAASVSEPIKKRGRSVVPEGGGPPYAEHDPSSFQRSRTGIAL